MKQNLKKLLVATSLLFCTFSNAQMVLEYNLLTPNATVGLPLNGTVNVTVNWGDGSAIETVTTQQVKRHTYATIGVKTVTISGLLSQYSNAYSTSLSSTDSQNRLIKVLSWDGLGLQNLSYAFAQCSNLIDVPSTLPSTVNSLVYTFNYATNFNDTISTWNTINVIDMQGMFANANNFNQPIGNWNISNTTNTSFMFNFASAFNQPLNSWNVVNVTKMDGMFSSATSFNQPIATWNVANVTNMSQMFSNATAFNQPLNGWNVISVTKMNLMFEFTSFNQPIGNWNVANVTNMSQMFSNNSVFNQPLNSWNVANVTKMINMFALATNFNQPIGNWSVANVTDMSGMFFGATSFNQPLSTWNVANVTNMYNMFYEAFAFNQPITNWNVTNVTNMYGMFFRATVFNQPIGNWNVVNVTDTRFMFREATNFEQNIGNWNVSNVNTMNGMFLNVKLCTENYDAILNGWSTQNVKPNVNFNGGLSKYSAASSAARSSLITNKSWVITDAGVATASDFCNLSNDTYEKEVFTIFPNPANSVLNINTDNQTLKLVSYEIYTLTGQRIQKNNFETLENKINIQSLSNGNYLLKLYTDKNSISKIFIKQ